MSLMRRFTKSDWDAFAGAECFENGSQPYIYERELDSEVILTIIADRTGLEIYLIGGEEDPDEQDVWSSKDVILTPLRARGWIEHLARYLAKYTYAPDLAYELDHPCDPVVTGFEYC